MPPGIVYARQIRIRTEAAARAVDVDELGGDLVLDGVEHLGLGDDHGRRPERRERCPGRAGHQDPPDVTGGAWTGCDTGGATGGTSAPPSPVGGSATRCLSDDPRIDVDPDVPPVAVAPG